MSQHSVSDSQELNVSERKRWLFFGLPLTFTVYTLQNKKLVLKEGFLNISENEILLYRIIDMTLKRSLMQRLFGLGSIILEAQDKSHPVLTIKNIRHVRQFRDLLANAVEQDKLRLRMRQGELIDPLSPDSIDVSCDCEHMN